MFRRLIVGGFFCAVLFCAAILVFADEGAPQPTGEAEVEQPVIEKTVVPKCAAKNLDIESSPAMLKEVGVLVGYASSRRSLIDKDKKYQLVPTMLRFGFNLKPLLNKVKFNPPGLTEFEFEPFANTVISPGNNAEVGFNILLKYAYPLTKRFYPYVEGGVGFVFMTQHTNEQGSQYNFLPQVGAGVMYLVKDNIGVSLGYRYRHLSNNGAEKPNKGINVDMVLAGVSLFY